MVTPDDDDDDDLVDGLTWDEWMALPEAETERRVDAAMREYNEVVDRMTPLQLYRHSRHSLLQTCLKWRALWQRSGLDVARDHLKKCQLLLLARRIQHRTGIRPGNA